MRVSLLYSPDAGDGVSLSHLRALIERHGHELGATVETTGDLSVLLESPIDLVAAAGGDGTFSAAARALAGRGIPLAVLPLGTANNIAKTLNDDDAIAQVIRRWHLARRQPFDIGIATGSWGERRFLEGAGSGLVPASIQAMLLEPAREETTSRIARALWAYRVTLDRSEPQALEITIDGETVRDEFLLAEVLNVPSIGPNLVLAPDISPSDGLFDVILATEAHREEIAQYLRDRAEGREASLSLPAIRAQRVEITPLDTVHLDGDLYESTGTLSIRMDPAALEVLT